MANRWRDPEPSTTPDQKMASAKKGKGRVSIRHFSHAPSGRCNLIFAHLADGPLTRFMDCRNILSESQTLGEFFFIYKLARVFPRVFGTGAIAIHPPQGRSPSTSHSPLVLMLLCPHCQTDRRPTSPPELSNSNSQIGIDDLSPSVELAERYMYLAQL